MIELLREPWLVRLDHLTYFLFPMLLGIGFIVGGIYGGMRISRTSLPLSGICMMVGIGVGLCILGVWLPTQAMIPTKIVIDDESVRVDYFRKPSVYIPRTAVRGVILSISGRGVSHANSIVYEEEGEKKYAGIFGGYRDAQGKKYGGRATVALLRELLNVP